jgi:hypothetical protein
MGALFQDRLVGRNIDLTSLFHSSFFADSIPSQKLSSIQIQTDSPLLPLLSSITSSSEHLFKKCRNEANVAKKLEVYLYITYSPISKKQVYTDRE